ncbi:MAG: hypothetical protein ACLPVY_05865 [Acidimicrobiia bacterium]
MANLYRGFCVFAVAATVTFGLAGCGSSSSPQVASLGHSNTTDPSSTTTLPKGNPTQLLDEWASCMRGNGTPNVADPTIDANGVIHIVMPAQAGGQGQSLSVGAGGNAGGPGGGPCGAYLNAATSALRGGTPLQKPDPAKLLKFSECMRAGGIPDFPDPSGDGIHLSGGPGSDLNPNNPTFQSASKLCAKKAGVPMLAGGAAPRGAIQITSGGPIGGPGGNGGAGAGVVLGAAPAGSQTSSAGK